MIAPAMLLIVAAAGLSAGQGLRRGPDLPDGLPQILVLDRSGNVASRLTCIRNQWVDPDESVARLIASREVTATVLALDGKLTEVDQLGPSRFDCLILPDEPGR